MSNALNLSVVVTGASAGIGLALCKQLALEHGCRVFLCSRSQEKGLLALQEAQSFIETARSATTKQGTVELLLLDVTQTESISQAAETVKKALNGDNLYALVNNAGTGLQHNVSDSQVLATNFFGPIAITEAFLKAGLLNEGSILI